MTTQPKIFTVRDWTARMTLLGKRRMGPVRSRLQSARVAGQTWYTPDMATASRVRVFHNTTRHH